MLTFTTPLTSARLRTVATTLIVAIIASTLAAVALAPAAQAAPTALTVDVSGGDILAGEDATFNVSVKNSGVNGGYNAAIILDLPVGVDFESSTWGAPIIYDATNPPSTPLAAGMQRWVWEDVSDLPVGGVLSGTVTVTPRQPAMGTGTTADTAVFPVGSTLTVTGSAAVSGDAGLLPVFNGATGVGGPTAIAETTAATAAPATATMLALRVTKSEPSPEHELVRGVHNHITRYRILVENTKEGQTGGTTLVDFVPAGLEFLGCANGDNSPAGEEYQGSGRIPTVNPGPVVPPVYCPTPSTVTTVVASAQDAAIYGVTQGDVYTRVEWSIGNLAAGQQLYFDYFAAIPLRANQSVFPQSGTPSPESGEQAANLENNWRDSTRQGSPTDALDGQSLTNIAYASGTYNGVVRTGADRATAADDSVTVTAMDLSVQKRVTGTSTFSVGHITGFDLTVNTSEYVTASEVELTDELPNGLCPLLPAGVTYTLDSGVTAPADCSATGTITGAEVVSATAHADGTFTLVLRVKAGTLAAGELPADAVHHVTYQALNRDTYVTSHAYGTTTSGDSFGNTVEVTGLTTSIDALQTTYPAQHRVWDDSGASLSTDLTEISKEVMPRTQVASGLGAGVDPCTVGSFSDALETGFRMGDTVCFELTVDYPSAVETRGSAVTDFLPSGLKYAGSAVASSSTVPNGQVTFDSSKAASGRLDWVVGVPGEGGARYVARGAKLVLHVWATVVAPSNGDVLDKPQNLMKYRQENVEGALYFLRDSAQIVVDPELQLVKGVRDVNGEADRPASHSADANGTVVGSDRDGISVVETEAVTYRIDLGGMGYPAVNAVVWDRLPAGITKANVSAISDGGIALNPGDAGYPSMLPSGSGSVVVWSGLNVPGTGHTLTYTVTIPVGTGIGTSLTNTASIVSYAAGTNTSNNPAAQVYVPLGSPNTTLTPNTPGAGTSDTSNVLLETATIAKSVTSPTDTNNSASQVVPGETATYTIDVTIPAHSTIKNGGVTDAFANSADWTVDAGSTLVIDPSGVTHTASFAYGGGTFTLTPATGALAFPATYSNTTGTDQVFTIVLKAHINPTVTAHNSSRANTATLRSGATTIDTDNASVTVIQPNPSVTKTGPTDPATAGQTVSFGLRASNAAGRPTSYDTSVTDCVPAGLTVVTPLPAGLSMGTATPGCPTVLVWNVGALAGGSQVSTSYQVTIDPGAAGGAIYTNTASLVGYTLDEPTAPRREITPTPASANVEVIGTTLTKTVDATTAVVGQERSYTLSTTLPANVNFYDAMIVDNGPASLGISNVSVTCVDANSDPCAVGNATLTATGSAHAWFLGDMLSSTLARTITITYTGTVLNPATGPVPATVVNNATLSWNTTDKVTTPPTSVSDVPTDHSKPSGPVTVTVQQPVVGITKQVNAKASDTVDPGETFTYAVKVSNTGTSTGYNVEVVDHVPAEVAVATGTISGGGVYDATARTITWTLAALPVGTAAAVTFTYDATLIASPGLTGSDTGVNTVNVTEYFSHGGGTGYDDDEVRRYTGPSASATVTPQFPAPRIAKAVVGSGPVYVGSPVTYSLTITNAGTSVADDVTVTDTLPAGFTFQPGSASYKLNGGAAVALTASATAGVVTFGALPDVSPTDTIVITYQSTPSSSFVWSAATTGSGVLHTNSAHVAAVDSSGADHNGDGTYEDDDTASVAINRADLSIAKSHTGAIVAGQNVTWSLQVTNNGPDSAVGPIVITDTLPGMASYVGISGAGWSAVSAPGVVTLTHAGPLASGASLTVTLTASIPATAAAGGAVSNTACVAGATLDLVTANDCATDPGTVTTLADLGITKETTASTYVAGNPITWTLKVHNEGPSVSRAPFTVTDTLPSQVDPTSVVTSGTGWVCGNPTAAGVMTCTYSGADLGVGSDLPTMMVTGQVKPSATGVVTNTATVAGVTPEPTGPGTLPNTDTATTSALGTLADLVLTKSLESDGLAAGETGRYRLAVSNDGPSDSVNVVIEDTLPSTLSFAGDVTSGGDGTWTCAVDDDDDQLVVCTLTSNSGVLEPGDVTWVEFDVDVDSAAVGTITNTATVDSDTTDPFPDNNEDSDSTPVTVQTDVAITKEHDATVVYRAGDQVTFTLTVSNNGPADALGVSVTDTLPVGMEYVDVVDDDGWTITGDPGDSEITFDYGSALKPGTSAQIQVIVALDGDALPSATNAVAVTTTTTDTDPTNNSDTDEVDVDTPDLQIVKTASSAIVEGGDAFSYSLVVTNVDTRAFADDVTVTDTIPADLKVTDDLTTVGGTDWTCTLTGTDADGYGGNLSCALASLDADTTAPVITVHVTVRPEVARDSIPNTAAVASPDEHPDAVDEHNSSTTTVTVKWIDATIVSSCVADAGYLDYSIDPHNVDTDLPITLTWYADADHDGVPDGPAVATQVLDQITGADPVTGSVLWPGAAVDSHGVGIAWPGWRVVEPGETPEWENMISDPSLPEYALRAGALVTVSINPTTTLSIAYPSATNACGEERVPDIKLEKVSSSPIVMSGGTIDYVLSVANAGYGATNELTLTDPIPAQMVVTAVHADKPATSTDPAWDSCTLTGAPGSQVVTCTLDGWLGYGQSMPTVVLTARLADDAGAGMVVNTASVVSADPDHPELDPVTTTDSQAVLATLAMTGFAGILAAWFGAVLLAGGSLLVWASRRRRLG